MNIKYDQLCWEMGDCSSIRDTPFWVNIKKKKTLETWLSSLHACSVRNPGLRSAGHAREDGVCFAPSIQQHRGSQMSLSEESTGELVIIQLAGAAPQTHTAALRNVHLWRASVGLWCMGSIFWKIFLSDRGRKQDFIIKNHELESQVIQGRAAVRKRYFQ